MQTNEQQILRVGINLTGSTGWVQRVLILDAKETSKCYVTKTRRINKDRLMQLENVFIKSVTLFGYAVYCLPEQETEAIDLIKKQILADVEEMRVAFQDVLGFVDKYSEAVIVRRYEDEGKNV